MERKMVVWIWISAKIAMYSAPHSGNKRCSPTLKEKGLKTAPVGMWFPVQKKNKSRGLAHFFQTHKDPKTEHLARIKLSAARGRFPDLASPRLTTAGLILFCHLNLPR